MTLYGIASAVSDDIRWIKIKNRDYWRYEMEREGAFKIRREQQVRLGAMRSSGERRAL